MQDQKFPFWYIDITKDDDLPYVCEPRQLYSGLEDWGFS